MPRARSVAGYATGGLAAIAAAGAALWLLPGALPDDWQPYLDWSRTRAQDDSYVVRIDLADIELKRLTPPSELVSKENAGAAAEADPATLPNERANSASLAASAPGSQTHSPPSSDPLDFTKAELSSLDFEMGIGERLTEKKSAIYDGTLYKVGIRIGSGGTISASAADLAKVLGGDRVNRLACCIDKDGYAGFADVRAAGISITYDPVADRLSLE